MIDREFCDRCQRKIIDGACRCPRQATPVDVLAVLGFLASHDWDGDALPGNAAVAAAVAAVAELIEAAGKAQDTNRDDFALSRPDVSGLPESERLAFLRGWDVAAEAVYRTGLRAALARCRGGQA